MCDACEDQDAFTPRTAPSPRRLRRARAIERTLPGTPVTDLAWRIATGARTGAITWAEHLRIAEAFRAADAAPAAITWAEHLRIAEAFRAADAAPAARHAPSFACDAA